MSMGLISETMDLWTDPNLVPFMAVTSHWIQGIYKETIDGIKLTLKLRSDLIGFQRVPGRHDGKHLATAFIYITDRIRITHKVQYFPVMIIITYCTTRSDGSHLITHPTMTPFLYTCTVFFGNRTSSSTTLNSTSGSFLVLS